MIGGIDVRIPTAAGPGAVDVAVRAVRQKWGQSVYENGSTGERYNSYQEIPFGDVEELFVYRDSQAADLWDEHGAIPEAYNTMIHLIHDDGLLTVVIDELTPEMKTITNAIRSGLQDPIHYVMEEAA